MNSIKDIEDVFPAFVAEEGTIPIMEKYINVSSYSSDKATVILDDVKGLPGQIFTFSVTAHEGYSIISVEINGSIVEPENGLYKGIINDNIEIKVTTKAIMTQIE